MHSLAREAAWAAKKWRLQHSSLPILVGPFTSEVGFCAMYWIPFVRALGIDPARIIPISRGGAAIWYGSPHGVELYDLREPRDIRIENILQHSKTGMLKQKRVTPFDRAIIKDAAKAAGLTRYHVLHPSWMYETLAPFWDGRKGLEWLWPRITREVTVEGKTGRAIESLTAPPLPEGLELPEHFTAVRFYLRATFPNVDACVQLARASIRQIAACQPVVLLNPGVHADEHIDLDVKDVPNVIKLKDLVDVPPRMNLALQSAVLAKATGFVGTYGGMAQLALRLGRPSLSYFLHFKGTAIAHKHLSDAMSVQTGVPFLTVRLGDIPVLKTFIPDVAVTSSSGGAVQPAEDVTAERAADEHHASALV